jgi:hypothetical protein
MQHVPAMRAVANLLSGRAWYCSLFSFLALLALAAGLGTLSRAADEPSKSGPAARLRQEALERFRKMSPRERLQLVEKAANGGRAFVCVTRADLDVTVRSVKPASETSTGGRTRIATYGLTYMDLERIRALPNVTAVAAVRSFPVEARRRERVSVGRLNGTVPEYLELAGLQ